MNKRSFAPLFYLFAVGCGLGAAAPHVPTPQAVTTIAPADDTACAILPFDPNATPNMQAGWASTSNNPVTSLAGPCGVKIVAYSCADASLCKNLEYTAVAGDNQHGKPWNGIVDLAEGAIDVCARQSLQFGYGSVGCKPKSYSNTADKRPLRIVLPVMVASGDNSTELTISLAPTAGYKGRIVIGQLGFDHAPTN